MAESASLALSNSTNAKPGGLRAAEYEDLRLDMFSFSRSQLLLFGARKPNSRSFAQNFDQAILLRLPAATVTFVGEFQYRSKHSLGPHIG